MNKFAIQKFTSPKSDKAISVNLADIFAVRENDGLFTNGMTYEGAGALLVTTAGYYLPVKEQAAVATELWITGLNKLVGTA